MWIWSMIRVMSKYQRRNASADSSVKDKERVSQKFRSGDVGSCRNKE